jgi:hypothetical protein
LWLPNPLGGWTSPKKSLLLYCGCVVRARASWSGTRLAVDGGILA